MKDVVVIGAGFSGLSAAYYLNQAGFKVDVYEMEAEPGGLIKTIQTPWGPCETAASGILNSKLFEDLAQDIGLKIIPPQNLSKRRYIYRGNPRRWPLSLKETLYSLFKFIFCTKKSPNPHESIAHWGERVIGVPATQFILAPALQGIYAGDVAQMSATLVLGRFFKKESSPKPKISGIVAPVGGLGEFFSKTESFLKSKGVNFYYNKRLDLSELKKDKIYVLATSLKGASTLLAPLNKKVASIFESIESLPLIKLTAFFLDNIKTLKGYGILFPRAQKYKTLGILFNNDRSRILSESYIFGGAIDKDILKYSDAEILKFACEDRSRLYGNFADPVGYHLQRWPEALPHYTIGLEEKLGIVAQDLQSLERSGLFIIGNYLGGIGLSQILKSASKLPQKIRGLHG